MTFTGRIRTYLIVVAVVPTLLVISVIYLLGMRQAATADRQAARRSLDRYEQYQQSVRAELRQTTQAVAASPYIGRAVLLLGAGRFTEVRLDAVPSGLDFLEITDNTYQVLASVHRPGLIAERLTQIERTNDDSGFITSIEYDMNGPHAALAYVLPLENRYLLYAGRYLDNQFTETVERLIGANVRIVLPPDTGALLSGMTPGQLYAERDSLVAVLSGGDEAGFYVAASFLAGPERSVFGNLLIISTLVALGSVLLAVALGLYISGRAKREFDNLISATARVSDGDFNTPVMAYDEGEFTQLADSFTAMTLRLKEAQRRLATTEKIAAWQAVGRKIAHEIKNPLTPIVISTDDLRRSYCEELPDFPRILDETTTTIKSEVNRLTRLLDEFVRFARMNPPALKDISPAKLLEPLTTLYRTELESGRLTFESRSTRRTVSLDPETIQQVLVNLIKNGLESSPDATVTLTLTDEPGHLIVTVADTGPGFPREFLTRSLEPYVSTKKGGSGLGLVISQRIIHDHGGTMELENRADHGALVTLRLPVHHG